MRTLTTETELLAQVSGRPGVHGCVLVPTMGALHDGHATLIRLASTLARERGIPQGCVVTIFVNPTQFGDPSDLARYPRALSADLVICEQAGASCVFAPSIDEVYPPGRTPEVPPLPGVATQPGLEDVLRPGHFAGVCQVVKRLFDLAAPSAAIFGEKDWQQLQVIRAMVIMLGLPIEIIGVPTIRELDGLALSSRNRFLSPNDRARGLSLRRALELGARAPTPPQAELTMREVLAEAELTPDYAVVRDAFTLEPPTAIAAEGGAGRRGQPSSLRALIAARVGSVRLIDNAPWPGL